MHIVVNYKRSTVSLLMTNEEIAMSNNTQSRRLIGQILLDGGFLSKHDLELAVAEQQHTNELLGEILVRMGVLDEAEIKAALSVQKYISNLEDATLSAAGTRQMLGSLLIMAGHLTSQQINRAIALQKKSGEKLGEIFINQGLLQREQLDSLLIYQHNQINGIRQHNPFRIGEILVTTGYITRQQLDEALIKQAESNKKLGEVLIDEGYAKPQHIHHGIHLQQKLISAALAAILSFSGLSLSGCGGGGGGGGGSDDVAAEQTSLVSSAYTASDSAIKQSFKTNYLEVTSTDYALAQPTFYYSTVNESFWSIQANVAKAVIDIDSESVIRIDIQKTANGFPRLNKTFSIGTDGQYEKFPGSFLVFNLKKSTGNKVESGIISFSPDSVTEQHVSGSYEVIMTDYDSGALPAPQYRIKGIFSFTMGEYGSA